MHIIKIIPNLLFEYQRKSGKFIRLPNRIEKIDSVAKIESNQNFLPELECSNTEAVEACIRFVDDDDDDDTNCKPHEEHRHRPAPLHGRISVLPWGRNFYPHTHPIPTENPVGIPTGSQYQQNPQILHNNTHTLSLHYKRPILICCLSH